MTWLVEQSLPILVMGGIVVIALAVGYVKTGQRGLLAAVLAAVVILIALIAVERWVVTDREQVEEVLFEIAAAVERNDIDGALSHISPRAAGVHHASTELRRVEFQDVDIKPNLEIEVFPERSPPTAEARFNVMVILTVPELQLHNERYPRYVEVTFVKDGDRWLVQDYQHYNPTRGMQASPGEAGY
ncbi:MAG: hypothetical protein KY475_08110 [Planctomycetes bacterium]|nr:hypothetical protein [Planctomycetota bacterium]